jgi:hypothetical protein
MPHPNELDREDLDPNLADEEEGEAEDQGQAEHGGHGDEETYARALGWVPESEWDDSRSARPPKFLTAREWIDRNEGKPALQREQMRKLADKLDKSDRKISEMHQVLTNQQRMHEQAKKRAVEKAIEDAKADMRRAVAEGDTELHEKAFKALEDAEAAAEADDDDYDDGSDAHVDERRPTAKPNGKPTKEQVRANLDPDTKAWLTKNKWFDDDEALSAVMVKEHKRVREEFPDLSVNQQLERAKARVAKRFPEEFGVNPNRNGKPSVMTPSGDRRGGGKTMADVPAEDRKAFLLQKKMIEERGGKYSEADFLKEYSFD